MAYNSNSGTMGFEHLVNRFNRAPRMSEDIENPEQLDDLIVDVDSTKAVLDRGRVGKAYTSVVKFLNTNHFFRNQPFSNQFALSQSDEHRINPEMQSAVNLNNLIQDLRMLAKNNDCPADRINSVAFELANILMHSTDSLATIGRHWAGKESGNSATSADGFYGTDRLQTSSYGFFFSPEAPGEEVFGQNMELVIPDIRSAMTIALLKPHGSITDRIFHKKGTASPVIRYVIPYDEVFDLGRASDLSHERRDAWDHRVPMLVLYRDPGQMSFTPIEVVAKLVNDPNGDFLVADGVLQFRKKVNLFDLAADVADVRTRIDQSSFLADNAFVRAIHFAIEQYPLDPATGKPDLTAAPTATENYVADLRTNPRHRLVMKENPHDSGDRESNLREAIQFRFDKKDADGNDTVIFAAAVEPYMIYLHIQMATELNRRTSLTSSNVFGWFTAANTADPDAELPDEIKELVAGLVFVESGYEVSANYSEENARMSTLIIRNNITAMTYELPATRNFLFEYSIAQSQPDQVLDTLNNVQQLGCDDRNLKLILQAMDLVSIENQRQALDPNFRKNSDNLTLNMRYAAGSRVNPFILRRTVNLADIVNVRSGDLMGDVRQYMISYLTKFMSEIHVNSLYTQMLDFGERPHYKVITSIPIMENLISVPHYHNHLNRPNEPMYEQASGGRKDYVHVLPSGVTLSILPCTFDYMWDKMIIIPYREDKNDDPFNFATNHDYGLFAAHYTPQQFGGVAKRLLVNIREYPIPTNLIGGIITIPDVYEYLPNTTQP